MPSTQESLTRLGGVQKAYRCGQPPKKVGAGRCRFCFSYMKDCTRNKCPSAPHALELVERSEAKTVANVFDSGVRAHTHIISPMMFQRKPNQVWHLRPTSSAKHTRELDSTGWGPESIQVWATTKTAKAKAPRPPNGPTLAAPRCDFCVLLRRNKSFHATMWGLTFLRDPVSHILTHNPHTRSHTNPTRRSRGKFFI